MTVTPLVRSMRGPFLAVTAASQHVVMFAVGLFVLSLFKSVLDVGMGLWITDHVVFSRRGRVVGLTETS